MNHQRSLAMSLLAAVIALALTSCAASTSQARYGARVAYAQGQPLVFPDFTLEFNGMRQVTPPKAPRSFLYYDFTVSSGDGQQTVSWSSGTGEISPHEFKVGDKTFLLELVYSERFGWLDEHELVVERE